VVASPGTDLPTRWAVLEAVPRAVIVTDVSGVVVAWNADATELYGWTPDEAIGRPIMELLSIEAHAATDEADLRAVASGARRSGDRWVRRRDGTPILVHTATRPILDDRGQVVAIVGVSEDVTEQRRGEGRMREVMDQLRTALDAGGLGTWRWDARTGRTVWDEELERLFGLPCGGFDGEFDTFVELLHPEDRASVLSTVEEAMRTGSRYRVEHRIVRPDGSVRWIRGAASIAVDEHGNSVGTVGCAADVTDEVMAAREMQRLNQVSIEAAERERLQRQRLEFIGRVNDALSNSSSVHDVMVRVTRALVPDLGTWCSLYVLGDGGDVPAVETWHVDPTMVEYARDLQSRFPYDPGAAQGIPAVIRERRSEFVPVIDSQMLDSMELPDEVRDVVNALELSSSIAVPLIKGRRVLGAINLVTARGSRSYSEDDVALAEALASRIAATIDNIRLREEARTTSTILQRSLLPAELPTLPGVELAMRYWPAGEGAVVGGDFYDVFATDRPEHWAIVIGDVCGTGPEAASLTGLARHTVRDAAWHGDAPGEVLLAVHRALQRSGSCTFLTAIYGELDLAHDTARLTIAVGGHPLPLLIREGRVSAIGEPGTLLGLVNSPNVRSTSHELIPGDMLVLYTDGATDMRPPLGIAPDEFEALVAACARDAGPRATVMADLLGDAFDAIQPFDRRDDDVAAMVLRLERAARLSS
jgi:PAS domain S-box-containing protein